MTSRVGALAATTVLLLLLLAWLGPGLAAPSPQRSASGWPGLWGILRDIRDVRHVRDTSRSDAADRPDRDQGPAARAHTSALGHVTRRVSDRVASMFRSVRSTLLHITSTGRTTESAATQPPQPTSDLETGASSDILSKEAADKREPEDAPTTAAARHQQQEEGQQQQQQQQQQSFVSSALERVRDAGRTFSEMGLAVGRWGKAMAEGVVGSTVNSAVGTVLQVFKGGKQDDNADHVCYPDLGCFSLREPWSSSKRPLPRMNAPESVRTQFFLHTRNTSSPDDPLALAVLNDTVTNAEALLRGARSFFIVHGFNDKTTNAWMQEFKDVLLETVDANVVLVDWAPGAQASRNYLQAASNTRIVGAELARLLEMLSKMGALSLDSVHVIGHSLGAHAAGYAGKQLSGRLARVTGLDAAQPAFEDQSAEVRIASGDAVFVDVVHTNGAPFIPTLGLGVMQPVGDADFYLNGGTVQPGCFVPKLPAVHSLMDLAALPVSVLGDMLSCSHRRAIEYFMEAVRGKCRMWGQRRGEATTPVSGDKATESSISRRQAPWWSPSRALGGLLPSVWGDSASPAGSRASGWPARGFSLSSLFSNFFSAPKSKDEGPVEDNAIADVTQPESDYPVSSPSDTADRVSPAPPPLARNKRPVHLPPPPPWCEGECIPLGLDTHLYGIRGTFDVQTADRPPYCVNQESNEIE